MSYDLARDIFYPIMGMRDAFWNYEEIAGW